MSENENLEKQIADDLSAVLKEAKAMGCKNVAYFRDIPLQNVDAVVQALEEIQQYRAIGTVEEIKTMMDEGTFTGTELAEIVSLLKEYQKYHEIGTVEEFKALKEKAEPKKPILRMNEVCGMFVDYADGHGEYKTQMNNWWRCPCCNSVVGQRVVVHKRVHDQRKKKFCEDCGTAIDWNE